MSITLDGSNANTVGVVNSATAQNSTSGTAINFTGIPAGIKRITVMFNGVSGSGTSAFLVQIGSGAIANTGYIATSVNNVSGAINSTIGYPLNSGTATNTLIGHMVITLVSGNIWVSSHSTYVTSGVAVYGGGTVTLSGTLDRVRITTVNGTDTFDAGSINILYE